MAEYRHFLLQDTRSRYDYTSIPRGGPQKNSPPRPERKTHAEKLLSDLERAEKKAKARQKEEPAREGLQFIPMVFDESTDFDLVQDQLENTSEGTRIVSAKERDGRKEYIVAIPDSEVSKFADKFRAYRDEDTAKGNPKNEKLSSSVGKIDAGELEDYWTGASETLPDPEEPLWWEVWLDSSETDDDVESWFRRVAAAQRIVVSPQRVHFPDRVVILGYASLSCSRSGLVRQITRPTKCTFTISQYPAKSLRTWPTHPFACESRFRISLSQTHHDADTLLATSTHRTACDSRCVVRKKHQTRWESGYLVPSGGRTLMARGSDRRKVVRSATTERGTWGRPSQFEDQSTPIAGEELPLSLLRPTRLPFIR